MLTCSAIFIPIESTKYDQSALLRSLDHKTTALVSFADQQLANPQTALTMSNYITASTNEGKSVILQGYLSPQYNPDTFDDTWTKLTVTPALRNKEKHVNM